MKMTEALRHIEGRNPSEGEMRLIEDVTGEKYYSLPKDVCEKFLNLFPFYLNTLTKVNNKMHRRGYVVYRYLGLGDGFLRTFKSVGDELGIHGSSARNLYEDAMHKLNHFFRLCFLNHENEYFARKINASRNELILQRRIEEEIDEEIVETQHEIYQIREAIIKNSDLDILCQLGKSLSQKTMELKRLYAAYARD